MKRELKDMKKAMVVTAISMATMIGCTADVSAIELNDAKMIMAESELRERMLDSQAVIMKDISVVQMCHDASSDGNGFTVVRMVYNAKNRFGGYVGTKYAYHSESRGLITELNDMDEHLMNPAPEGIGKVLKELGCEAIVDASI